MCTPSRGDIDPGEHQESNPWNIERKTQSLLVPLFSFRDIYPPPFLDGYVYIDYRNSVQPTFLFLILQDPAIIVVQSLATDKEGPENVTKKEKEKKQKL